MSKKTEVKPGLMMIESPAAGGTKITFENSLRDKMYKCTYGFKGGSVKPLGDTKEKDGKYTTNVYPGATAEFVVGSWTGVSKSHGCGPPDKAWVEAQASESKGETEKELKFVKALLQKKGMQKVTAPAVAEACEEAGVRFVDVTFPPRDSTIQPAWLQKSMKLYPWKRPSTYLKGSGMKPTLFVDRIEPGDIDQGSLNDCYLMGALASVAEFEWLVRSMFDEGQNVELGCYRVSLSKNGWFQTVLVDDFLPCSGNKPAYSRNREEPNELWVSLTEKAYAKLHGSYGAVMTGACHRALADLTGCPAEQFELTDDFWPTLLKNDQKDFLQVLGTPGKNLTGCEDTAGPEEKKMWDKYQKVGLICEHCYSLITVLETKKEKHRLCLIRNPWGNEKEWNGKWSDQDKASWTKELQKECKYVNDESDGSFWMEWNDVKKWFSNVSVCYTHGQWDQVHIAGNFNNGVSDVMVQVRVKKPMNCWFAVHQKDPRGVEPSHRDSKLEHMTMLVGEVDDGTKENVPAKAVAKRSLASRDLYSELSLKPGKTYNLVAQPKDAMLTKSIVYSLLVESSANVEITFHTPTKGENVRMEKLDKDFFPHSKYSPTKANYQIKGQFTTNGSVMTKVGSHVSFKGAKKEINEKNLEKAAASEEKNKKRKKGEAVKVEGAEEAPTRDDSLKLNVRLIRGKGLVSMDSNGLSDPFCEIKLREVKDGKICASHPNPQKKVSKVCAETLDPVWEEQFVFLVPRSDCIRISIFDKDIVGKDNMGRVDLVMSQLEPKLKQGKEYVTAYEVKPIKAKDPVSGKLEIGVTLL